MRAVDNSRNFPWLLIGLSVSLVILGMVLMGSASISVSNTMTGTEIGLLIKQLTAITLGVLVGLMILMTPLSKIRVFVRIAVFFMPVILVLVWIPGIGAEVNGANRWIRFAGQQLQTSEIAKFVVILYMADFLERRNETMQQNF